MTKVTVKEPAAPVHVDKKPKFESVVDSLGRTIQLRQLDPLQQGRLVMAVGGDVSANSTYMNGFALPAAMVAHIDDQFYGFPSSVREIESMLTQLGVEGMAAINSYLYTKMQALQEEADKEAAAQAEVAAAKN
jgi:hypothetical protein